MLYVYKWQAPRGEVIPYSDSDHGGNPESRKSTTSVVSMTGSHLLGEVCVTQAVPAILSAEAEFYAMVRAAIEGLFLRNIYKFFRREKELRLKADASAARSLANRLGLSKKQKHLDTQWCWLQYLVRDKKVQIGTVKGEVNPADLMTKPHGPKKLRELFKLFAIVLLNFDGTRSVCGELRRCRRDHFGGHKLDLWLDGVHYLLGGRSRLVYSERLG